MGDWGDKWSEIMQSKPARIVLNGICVVITASYAVGGVIELVSPRSSSTQLLVEQLGETGYLALTITRTLVCLWVSITFIRMIIRTINE